ncbi:hypothetical protein MUA03_17500 [Enterobacteriaceae bacterium H16N7]|nr:hypothetical protein [Dryocola clanedunensis]
MKLKSVNIDRLIKIISGISLVVAGATICLWLPDSRDDIAKNGRCEMKASLSKPVPVNPATGKFVVGFERWMDNEGGGLCAG